MNRLHIVFTFFCILLFIIILRLFYVQVLASDSFSSNDYLRTVRITPLRGIITDRNEEPIVVNETRYTLFAEPKVLENKDATIRQLDETLAIGEATLEAKLKGDKSWIALAKDLSEDQKQSVERLKIHGLGFDETSRRFYPEASLAAHLTGFVGKDQDGDGIGYFGVEGYYNKDLEGLPGILKTERDVLGRPIVIGTQDKLRGENGRRIVLTIDKSTQVIAKMKLKKALDTYKAQSGCVTVADPFTLEILAMTCLPDFDPVAYKDFDEKVFKNPIISNSFEPGSIFKPLIVAAALEEKAIKPKDTFDEEGPIKIGGYFIRTWDNKYHGKTTMTQILETSSNVGMVYIGEKLGNDKVKEYINEFGFGKATNIDIQGEAPSYIKPKWYPIDYATATFGQGIAVTQIQMIAAFSSIINGGWLMQPHVVKSLTSENGDKQEITPKKIKRIVSDRTSTQIKEMLRATVKHGEAKWKVPDGYEMGGKTGTAQIALEGTYDESKTYASYIGFAPVKKPKFIMLVTLNQPETSQWASETAAPLFFEIAKDLLVEYNVAPD
ncbi:penicillin-binding protein 2 [Candidatus Woesebacteria bacterium]|nr:penicillin-binding protein 2 [Candidatus Woesebacteria bacterium]